MIEKILLWVAVFGLALMAIAVVGLWLAGYWAAVGLFYWDGMSQLLSEAGTTMSP